MLSVVSVHGRLRDLDDRLVTRMLHPTPAGKMTVPKRLVLVCAVLLVVSFASAVVEPSILRWGLFDHPWAVIAMGWLSRKTFWLGVVAAGGLVLAWLSDYQAEGSASDHRAPVDDL